MKPAFLLYPTFHFQRHLPLFLPSPRAGATRLVLRAGRGIKGTAIELMHFAEFLLLLLLLLSKSFGRLRLGLGLSLRGLKRALHRHLNPKAPGIKGEGSCAFLAVIERS